MSAKKRRQTISSIDAINSTSTPKQSISKRTRKSISGLKLEANLLSESIENNLSTSLSSSKISENNDDVEKPQFALDEIVWAKTKGYQFWPAKIVKFTKSDSSNKSKEYLVTFFGQHQKSYVPQNNIKPYSSEKIRADAFKRVKKEKFLRESIEEADQEAQRLVVVDANHSIKINGVTSTSLSKDLPSVEEELSLIKKSKNGDSLTNSKLDLDSDKSLETSRLSKRRASRYMADESSVLQNKSNTLKTSPASVSLSQKAKLAKELKQLTGEDLNKKMKDSKEKFEHLRLKSAEINEKFQKKNQKKRSLSVDIKTETIMLKTNNENTPLETKTKKRRTKYKEDEEELVLQNNTKEQHFDEKVSMCTDESPLLPLDIGLSQTNETVDYKTDLINEINDLQFKSVTIVVDTNSSNNSIHSLIYYLIEKLNDYYEKITNNASNDNNEFFSVFLHDISVCTKKKLNCIIDEQNGKVSPNTSSSTCEDEPQEFELVSQAKSPISNSSIKIEKKKRDKRKFLETYLNNNISKLGQVQLNFVNEFDQAIKSDVILSLVDLSIKNDSDKNGKIFGQSILDYDLEGVKYISLVPIENAARFHYHFNYNSASFIESPLIQLTSNHKETKLKLKAYVSTWDTEFYKSCSKLFNMLIEEKNLIFKGDLFGVPSDLVRAYKTSQIEETLSLAIEKLKLKKSNKNLETLKMMHKHELNQLILSRIDSLLDQF